MQNSINVKELIYNYLQEVIKQKIETTQKAIQSAKESRDNDTKSSMGDKYETGRAMIQMELEKYEAQLINSLKSKNELLKLDIKKTYNKIEFGSLVSCNHGNYFISLGVGKVSIENKVYFCISLASPIGKVLQNRNVGDKVEFHEKEFIIHDIV